MSFLDSSSSGNWWYQWFMSSLLKTLQSLNVVMKSSVIGACTCRVCCMGLFSTRRSRLMRMSLGFLVLVGRLVASTKWWIQVLEPFPWCLYLQILPFSSLRVPSNGMVLSVVFVQLAKRQMDVNVFSLACCSANACKSSFMLKQNPILVWISSRFSSFSLPFPSSRKSSSPMPMLHFLVKLEMDLEL